MFVETAANVTVTASGPIEILQAMSTRQMYKYGVTALFALIGGGIAVLGLRRIRVGLQIREQRDHIAETESTPAAEVTPGAVEVNGTARVPEDGETLEAPLSGKEAVAVSLTYENTKQSTPQERDWLIKFKDGVSVPFLVEDDSGSVLVDPPADAELTFEPTVQQWSEWDSEHTTFEEGPAAGLEDPAPIIREYAERHADIDGEEIPDYLGTGKGKHRYTEAVLEPGEDVYVLAAASERATAYGRTDAAVDEVTETDDFVVSDRSQDELVEVMTSEMIDRFREGAQIVAGGIIIFLFFWFTWVSKI